MWCGESPSQAHQHRRTPGRPRLLSPHFRCYQQTTNRLSLRLFSRRVKHAELLCSQENLETKRTLRNPSPKTKKRQTQTCMPPPQPQWCGGWGVFPGYGVSILEDVLIAAVRNSRNHAWKIRIGAGARSMEARGRNGRTGVGVGGNNWFCDRHLPPAGPPSPTRS